MIKINISMEKIHLERLRNISFSLVRFSKNQND